MSKHRRPKVFTYFSRNVENVEAATKRLNEWRENWTAAGYEPVVLQDFQVVTDRATKPYVDKLAERNTNPPTFLKWIAAAVRCPVDEFCIVCDYNVFNYGFIPDMNAGRLAAKKVNVLYAPGTSDVIFAGKEGLLRQASMFCHFTPAPDQRYCDLDVLKHQEVTAPELSATIDATRVYGEDGWLEAKLVRFPAGLADPKSLRDWTKKPEPAEVAA